MCPAILLYVTWWVSARSLRLAPHALIVSLLTFVVHVATQQLACASCWACLLGQWDQWNAVAPMTCVCCHTVALLLGRQAYFAHHLVFLQFLPACWVNHCICSVDVLTIGLLTPVAACAQGVPEPGRGQAADGHRVVAVGGARGAGLPGQPRGALHRPGHHPYLGRQLDGVRRRGPFFGAFYTTLCH